jgi:signal transduction histidine kinase
MTREVPRKWRPSLGLVVALVLAMALTLPLAGLIFFRIYENQILRQTEAELIGQAAVLAAEMRREIETNFPPDAPLGAPAPKRDDNATYQPIAPALDLSRSNMLGRRPDPQPAQTSGDPAFIALGEKLAPDLVDVQKTTLAGFRLLDPNGRAIAGGDLGQSFAHIEEVARALRGEYGRVLRQRISKHEAPPLYSLSRGTSVRIFIAAPVVARGAIAGVVYVSRTPSNIFHHFYQERDKVALGGLTVVLLALVIGVVFHRAIAGPMRALVERTGAIARGEPGALRPLNHHGTAEFAILTQSFFDMARHLQNRGDFIATFAAHVTHELKSPLTSIRGAAELLRDDLDASHAPMSDSDKRRFLDNIIADSTRLTALAQRLRELARAEHRGAGQCDVKTALNDARAGFEKLDVAVQGEAAAPLAMAREGLVAILTHLLDNAARHGAHKVNIICARRDETLEILVSDNGAGVSANNRDRIFESFFTTRREEGGTGMGLAIVRALLRAHGGDIALCESPPTGASGACFALRAPLA